MTVVDIIQIADVIVRYSTAHYTNGCHTGLNVKNTPDRTESSMNDFIFKEQIERMELYYGQKCTAPTEYFYGLKYLPDNRFIEICSMIIKSHPIHKGFPGLSEFTNLLYTNIREEWNAPVIDQPATSSEYQEIASGIINQLKSRSRSFEKPNRPTEIREKRNAEIRAYIDGGYIYSVKLSKWVSRNDAKSIGGYFTDGTQSFYEPDQKEIF